MSSTPLKFMSSQSFMISEKLSFLFLLFFGCSSTSSLCTGDIVAKYPTTTSYTKKELMIGVTFYI